jgi:hypothetical protein
VYGLFRESRTTTLSYPGIAAHTSVFAPSSLTGGHELYEAGKERGREHDVPPDGGVAEARVGRLDDERRRRRDTLGEASGEHNIQELLREYRPAITLGAVFCQER